MPSFTYLAALDIPVKLGAIVPKVPAQAVRLRAYMGNLPAPPPVVNWRPDKTPMYANNQYGDCTCATVGHIIGAWTHVDEPETPQVVFMDKDILGMYSAVTGFDPSTGANDNGAVITDVLNYWKRHPLQGHGLLGYARVSPRDAVETKTGVWLFGGLYLGINLPYGWQRQTGPNGVWDKNAGPPGSWGGHAVPLVSYTDDMLYVVTWGGIQKMTWAGYRQYCFEAWACLGPDWTGADKKAPPGFMLRKLQEDMRSLGGDPGPLDPDVDPVPPTPPPTPDPPGPTPTPPNWVDFLAELIRRLLEEWLKPKETWAPVGTWSGRVRVPAK